MIFTCTDVGIKKILRRRCANEIKFSGEQKKIDETQHILKIQCIVMQLFVRKKTDEVGIFVGMCR